MFKKLISKASMLTIAAAAMLAPVEARSANLPAAAGFPIDACINRSEFMLWNKCLTTPATIPVPLTSYKTYTLKARVRGNSSEATSCKGVRWDNNNDDWFSTLEGASSSLEWISVSLGTISVPSGSLTFQCSLATRTTASNFGAVHSVDWN